MSEDALNQGIELIRSGNIPMGLKVLAELVKTDPQNDLAWAWLSVCYAEQERKIYCLNRAVRINPKNPIALEGLARLGEPLPVVAPIIEEAQQSAKQTEDVPATLSEGRPSVLSKFETAESSTTELEPPDWSAKGRRPRLARKNRGKTNPLLIIVLIVLLIILVVVSWFVLPRIINQAFPAASNFNENTQALIQEVDLLMAISDGSNNLGAFKTQQALVYKSYDRLLPEWPASMVYQKNEVDTALKGWSAVGAIADVAKGSADCKVEGSLLEEVKSYTNALAIDLSCTEWATAVLDIANKHFNQARPGLESYYARK